MLVLKNKMGNFFTKQKHDCDNNAMLLLEINELKKQNECLRALNATLTKASSKSIGEVVCEAKFNTTNSKIELSKHISVDAIEEYVNGMIADSDINITYLPDFVERQLYKNVLKMVLGILDNILNNSHITVFNHEINFELVPLKQYNNEDINNTTNDMVDK
jgi:hypothetical protein